MPSKRTNFSAVVSVLTSPAAAVCLMLLATGCEQRIPVETMGSTIIDGDATSECANRLSNALTRLAPSALGVTSKESTAAISLNEWFERCGDADWSNDWGTELSGLVGDDTARRAKARIFSEADAQHIRTCLLLNDYSQAVEGGTELQRIVSTFYGLMRDVALVDDENPLALTPFEVLLAGRGTASDRAWLFVATLRQRRIDAVVLTAGGNTETRLVGVSSGGEVYLFDVKLGLPVFKADANKGDILPQTPATLADLAGDDEILGAMGSEKFPYPLKDADMGTAKAWMVGSASTWSQRTLILQDRLRDSSAVLADPIAGSETTDGLLDRVAAMGKAAFDKASIGAWQYPLAQLDAYSRLNEADLARLDALMDPFQAQVARKVNVEQTAFIFGNPKWELFKARIRQLQGALDDTVTQPYQNIRKNVTERELEASNPVGERITVKTAEDQFILHRRAREDAGLWVAVHQFRTENYDAATNGYYGVRRMFDDTIWSQQLRYLLALSLSSHEQVGQAMTELAEGAEAGGAAAEGHQRLHDWWKSEGHNAVPREKAKAAPQKAETPKEPAEGNQEPADGAETQKPAEAPEKKSEPAEEKMKPEEPAATEAKKAEQPAAKPTPEPKRQAEASEKKETGGDEKSKPAEAKGQPPKEAKAESKPAEPAKKADPPAKPEGNGSGE